MVFSYAGTGRMPQFVAVKALGLISYSYTSAIEEQFLYLDFGALGRAYWVIADHASKVIEDYKDDQIVDLVESGGPLNQVDYGSITEVEAYATDDWGEITVTSNIQAMGRTHFHSLTTWSVIKTWVGTGTVWEMDGGTRYRLDAPWIGSGTLRPYGSANTHYVPAIATEGLLPLRSDTKVVYAPNWNAFGTLFSGSFAGEAVTKVFPEDPRYSIAHWDSASDLYYNDPWPGSSLDPTLGTALRSGGSGTGTAGGFNVGPHIRFGGSGAGTNGYRRVVFKKDLRNVDRLEIYAIKGNGSNGGEEPDPNEDLKIDFSSNFNDYFGDFFTLIPETDTNPGVQRLFIDVPAGAKREDQELSFYQLESSGTPYDHYGVISVRYLTASEPTDGDTSKRLLGVYGNAGVSFRPNWVGSGVLFNFSTTTFSLTYDYVGEGTLFGISSTEEKVVWDYNNSSIDYFTYENFGSVAESPINSITIQSIANETIQSRANERIIDLVVSGSTSGAFLDFGSILTDGEQTPSTVGLDWGHILTNQTDYPFGLFPISGTAKQVFTPNFVGSGSLFAFVSGRGRTKPRWIAYVNIGIFGAAKTNFSLLHIGSGSLFSINNADDSRAYAYRGSGALYAFSGAAEAVGFNPPEDTAILPLQGAANVAFAPNWIAEGTVKAEGTAVERQTDHYKGSGTLFNFETAVEKITYHYSSTSNDIFQYRNYGSVADQPIESITIQSIANETIESRKDDRIIDLVVGGTTSGSYLDYGPILIDGEDAPETVREDYGSIMESISRYAMGDLLVHGTAAVRREFSYVGKGDLFAFIEGRGRTKPRWIANVNIEVKGEAQDAVVKRFIGDGNLFNFEKAEERRTFGYEGQGTFSTSGEAGIAYEKAPYPGYVLFDVTGDTKVAFVPNFNGSGVATIDVEHVERTTFSEVGSGVLFDMGNLVERRTYHYSHTSDTIFTPLDYGSVGANPIDSITIQSIANDTIESRKDQRIIDLVTTGSTSGSYFDYGSVSDFYPSITDDYEGITETVTRYAMGGPQISGAADVNFRPVYVGSGNITINVSTIVRVLPRWIAFVPIDFTGAATDTFTKAYKGSGIVPLPVSTTDTRSFAYEGRGELFAINGGEEAFAFDYPRQDPVFTITGEANVAYVPNWNGSGTAVLSGTLVERAAFNPPARGDLFSFNNLDERRTYHYNSSSIDLLNRISYGSVASPVIDSWVIANHATKVIQDYRNDKIVDLVEGSGGDYFDYGFLEQENIGGLPNINTPDATEDYQFIRDPDLDASRYPFGHLFKFSGRSGGVKVVINLRHIAVLDKPTLKISGDVFVKLPNKHEGSGVLFNTGGAAESATFSEIKDGLFEFVGFAATRRIPNFNGGGTITLDGASSSAIAFAGFQENTIVLRGNATVKYTPSYTGSGAIFSAGILSESITKTFPLVPGYTADLTVTAADINSLVYKFGTLVTPAVEYTTSGTDAFNIGPHFRFGVSGTGASYSADGDRTVAFTLDLRNVEELTLNIVKGNGTNGGNAPECFNTNTGSGDNLVYQINGSNETTLVSACETSFETLNSVTIPVPVADRISNARVVIHQQQHSGSTLDAWGFKSVEYTINRAGDQRKDLFDISGVAGEKATAVYSGSGSLFALSGAVEAVAVAEEKRNLIKISGNAGERFIPNFNGSGSLSVLSGAAESRTASPDDLFTLFDFTGRGTVKATVAESGFALLSVSGTTEPEILTFAEQPFGTATISGNAGERYVPNYRGFGRIAALSGAAESFTANPLERQLLFSMGGIATEAFSAAAPVEGTEIKLSGTTSPEIRTFAEQPLGDIFVGGLGEYIHVDVYGGFGTLFSRGFTSESVTFKIPPVREGDILFRGEAVERVAFNPPEETAHLLLSGEVVIPLRTFAEQPTVRVAISGVAIEKNTEVYVGTGAIFSNGFTSESVTRKLPEFTAHLNVTGLAEERATFREIFFGSLFKFRGSAGRALLTFAEQPQTLSKISGVATTTRARDFVGEGNIATLSGAAEAVTFNPLERDLLFDVTGIAAERRTNAFVGDGQIQIRPEAADYRFTPNWNAEGVIPVSGTAVERVARDEVVRVLIGTFSGAAESVTFNPLEKDALFSFTGRASIASAVSEVKRVELALFAEPVTVHIVAVPPAGEGTATISGVGVERSARDYIGQIHIGTFSGAAESLTVNPLERQLLFSATGIATLRSTRAYVGTGSLFALNGAAESRAVAPPAEGLYDITGEAKIVIAVSHIGDGNLFSFVKGAESFTYDYVGEQVLFNLSGEAVERITNAESGFGSIFSIGGAAERVAFAPSLLADVNIAGRAATPRSRVFTGSGDLYAFGGAAESRTITYENVAIFDFLGQVKPAITKVYVGDGEIEVTGEAAVAFTRAPYLGQTEVQLSGTATERTTANPPEEGTEIATSGEAKVLRSFGYEGSGQLKVHGDTIIGISLRIFGTGSIKVDVRTTYFPLLKFDPDVHIYIAGSAATVKIDVAPPRTYGWII
jgi:hypothetical protein